MQMKSRQNFIRANHGFTIIELLIAMVVALLALGAIYSTFLNQQKSYVVQQETAAMHQNIRSAAFYMEKEIRMAGCDPTGDASAGIPTVPTVGAGMASIRFTEDVSDGAGGNSDGDVTDPNEDITYGLDGNRNLIRTDNNGAGLGSAVSAMVAQNIDAIDFVYLDDASPPNVLNDYIGSGGDVPAANISRIRSVEITIVARTGNNTLVSPNNNPYLNQRGRQILGPQGDYVSRRRITYAIKCRNLGL